MTRQEMVEEIITAQRAIFRALRATATPVWLELDLTMAQMKTLRALEHRGPAPISQIADALGISVPTASHLVERLVQAGLAERAEDRTDRRRTLASLSAQGERLVRRLSQGREQMRRWLPQLDPDDLAALHRGLRALARAVQGRDG